jgi:hypothetical protein
VIEERASRRTSRAPPSASYGFSIKEVQALERKSPPSCAAGSAQRRVVGSWSSACATRELLFEHRPGPQEWQYHRGTTGSKGRNAELVRKSMSDNRGARLSRLVDELTEAAKRLGLEVRRERILREVGYRARGGACRLREKYLIIIDRDQPPSEQIEVLVEALRDCDLEQLYLSPEARRILQSGPEQT